MPMSLKRLEFSDTVVIFKLPDSAPSLLSILAIMTVYYVSFYFLPTPMINKGSLEDMLSPT